MALQLVTPPTAEIITLAEAKSFLRVDHTDDDTLIGMLIKAARLRIEGPEGKLNALFLTQTWDLILDRFPCSEIRIPLQPIQSVESITYFDPDGFSQTMSTADYYLDDVNKPPFVLLMEDASWPDTLDAANSVTIRFVGGYAYASGEGVADNVPDPVKIAVMQMVGHWYERRDYVADATAVLTFPEFIWDLLQPYKMFL